MIGLIQQQIAEAKAFLDTSDIELVQSLADERQVFLRPRGVQKRSRLHIVGQECEVAKSTRTISLRKLRLNIR